MVGVPEIADLILSAFKVSTPRAHRPAPPLHDAQSAPCPCQGAKGAESAAHKKQKTGP